MKLVSKAGLILAAWIAALATEQLVIGLGDRRWFAGPWETRATITAIWPVVIAGLIPAAFVLALFLDAATERRRWVGFACGIFTGAIGWGVSYGRHVAPWEIRIPFVCACAAGGIIVGYWILPWLLPSTKESPKLTFFVFGLLGVIWWSGDAFVLPRLYPVFHHGAIVVALVSFGVCGWSLFREEISKIGIFAIVLGLGCAAWTPYGVKKLETMDNLRMVLVDRAPMLGRGVRVATKVWPPKEIEGEVKTFGEITRSLDWTGKDIVLISIDALRADHVGAYGYERPTTPRIDAIANEGAIFDAAYCATPHTSYSITSMMTGKYMRPLLALGLGEDSQTLADWARLYGYRTAAFYPPAVFFIDEHKFQAIEDRALGFEYKKIEFANPELRRTQLTEYLDGSDAQGKPLFLWVHFFEPHEPYVVHPEHAFGPKDIDAYDSEIAAADDGVGYVVDAVRKRRPNAVFVITADHGEEFGEHGGRYHGTTVYEEQVRVPFIVSGQGVVHANISSPVQTIDIVPTLLSAMGVPRPARIRGRDLGPMLSGKGSIDDPGFAFAETDDQTLVAERNHRLICARRAGACALFDAKADPRETKDVAAEHAADTARLKGTLTATARDTGKYDAQGSQLPEAIRRGMQGDVDADQDVAVLLDDANVDVRRKAASVLFDLKSARVKPQLARAVEKDEDAQVKRWASLALVRIGETVKGTDALLSDGDVQWRRAAAIAYAERGDRRGESELVAYWRDEKTMDFVRARDLLRLFGALKTKAAVPVLVPSLEDVRLRSFVADALGAIGDPAARPALLAIFAKERYETARTHEAKALVLLGEKDGLREPLATFIAEPDPMLDAVAFACEAGILKPPAGWSTTDKPVSNAKAVLDGPPGPSRLAILLGGPGPDEVSLAIGAKTTAVSPRSDAVRFVDFDKPKGPISVEIGSPRGVLAFWMVRR